MIEKKVTAAVKIEGFEQLDETVLSYFKNKEDGVWYIWLPGCGLGNLTKHTVTEHEDGTISAEPSILVTAGSHEGRVQRHGYLKFGMWEDC